MPKRDPDPEPEPVHDVGNITEERAARRFHQMHHQQALIGKLDAKIATAKEKLSALKDEREGVVAALLAAARDEGDLPLFADLD